ncbi:hypothetical protein NL319_27915, partial [Klebsiella pneumoniae]|nr:hypothetical protein [Klebsiella pneumoniae]
DSAPSLEKALAAALGARPADAPADGPPAESAATPAFGLPSGQAAPDEAAAAQQAPVSQSAGALLNALLSAALTGQAALGLHRPDRYPL